jgi:transcriptional regulator with XRE-family HTH domain
MEKAKKRGRKHKEPSDFINKIRLKIREIRERKGIKQKEVAELAGLSVAAYSNIESGNSHNITIEVGIGIAKALNVPFGELFEIEGNSPANMKIEQIIEEKESKRKELQEVIQKNDQLIKLLQKENKELFKAKAGLELKENFGLYHETENKIREAKDGKEIEKLREYQKRVNGYFISKKISDLLDSGVFSRFEILELIFENDKMVEDMYYTGKYDPEVFANHFSEFMKISIEEISAFLEMYEAKASRSG